MSDSTLERILNQATQQAEAAEVYRKLGSQASSFDRLRNTF
ncbi:hypothetical protein MC7420_6177 [Coleofasciculus chthonoplastes PCC 7420]|uniref:Uncharacterized protein n=1 Tax=Coleofasciculus chthonoplastes PCC 7420 TaxID=118168 RepID=B4VTI3_9CYAN|nr:hypothetical protein MC7420_6177 [Coleofasciculus chthonoplastes PCC 7420]